MAHSDVVIVGAGVSGASIAYHLSRAGYAVTVIDRATPGSGASGACDQAVFLQSKRPGLHLRLALDSRRIFDTLAEQLDADLEFKTDGGMVALENDDQLAFMTDFVSRQREAGIEIELLSRDDARRREPSLADHIVGAAWSALDAEVSPLRLNVAYLTAAQRHGARLLRHCEMLTAIEDRGGIRGIRTTHGDLLAETVVNAGGPYAGLIGDRAGIDTPVRPRRGVILITQPTPRLLHGILLCGQYVAAKHLVALPGTTPPPYGIGLSLGQTAAGNLLIGGSREFVGFRKDVPAEVVRRIARHATRIVPELRNIRLLRAMAGFRPYTGDGLPIIEMTRPGWITAAGHEGDGIALAPITGQLVLDLLTGAGPTHHYLAGLTGDRPSLTPPELKESVR